MVAPMAKAEDSKKKDSEKKDEASLKVSIASSQLVSKLAHHRGLSIKELFLEKDVEDFLSHLLLEEMRKEAERINKAKRRN